MNIRNTFAGAFVALAFATGANAATVSVTAFDPVFFADEQTNLFNRSVETFETVPTGQITGPLVTQGGAFKFSTLGGTGTGTSVTGNGKDLAVRTGNNAGRVNTTLGGSRFLDSNDTFGMKFDLFGTVAFDTILFTLTDVADAAGSLTITSGLASQTIAFKRANGLKDSVLVLLDGFTNSASVELRMNKLNDGFGLDDVTFGRSTETSGVAPIPLPAAGWMMLAGLGAIGAFARRKKA